MAAFVASVSLCDAAPLQTQTYLVAKQGNCGKQILRQRLFTLGDIYSNLHLALHSVTRILHFEHYPRTESPAPQAESPAYLSAAYHLVFINLHKSIIFHCVEPKICRRLKICSIPIHPPPSRYPFDLALSE